MHEFLLARSGEDIRSWGWQPRLVSYCDSLGAMLARSVAEEGILGYRTAPTAEEVAGFCADLEHRLASGAGHLLLGEDDAGIVGMCIVNVATMPNSRHIAEVSKAYLEPRVRRTTAVAELAMAVCQRMREQDVETLRIDVRENTPAHQVWQRFGFTTYGILDDYSRVNGVSHRGHFMTHSVDRLQEFVEERLRHAAVTMERNTGSTEVL
jgi:ribosomal protein S18 acetylase RimI-like enzyme